MSATDDFAAFAASLIGPLMHLAAVTPSDSADLVHVSRVIFLGAAGAIQLTTEGGETITLASGVLAAGVPHPIRATRIWATSTTATPIVVGW